MKSFYLFLGITLFGALEPAFGASAKPIDIVSELNGHNVIVCEVEGKQVSIQIQFVGNPKDWVVWYLGKARGVQRIVDASISHLEGMNLLSELSLELEKGRRIFLTLDQSAVGYGTLIDDRQTYSLVDCHSKF